METAKENGKKPFKVFLWGIVALLGVAAAAYTPAIPEPAKLLLLGAVLVGVAFWEKKQLAAKSKSGEVGSVQLAVSSKTDGAKSEETMGLLTTDYRTMKIGAKRETRSSTV